MNLPLPGNPLWQAHLEQLQRIHPAGAAVPPRAPRGPLTERGAAEARRGEWTAAPPGRLGRLLLADVERYLEFFSIARED
jgi:hypothetical protein